MDTEIIESQQELFDYSALEADTRGKACHRDAEHAGQVVIGNAPMGWDKQPQWWLTDKICTRVPSPAVQLPDLLIARPEEKAKQNLSCAEIQMANAQSLAVNQRVAAEATDMLIRFLSGTLTRCATYFDLNSGAARADYCLKPKGRLNVSKLLTIDQELPEAVERFVGKIRAA